MGESVAAFELGPDRPRSSSGSPARVAVGVEARDGSADGDVLGARAFEGIAPGVPDVQRDAGGPDARPCGPRRASRSRRAWRRSLGRHATASILRIAPVRRAHEASVLLADQLAVALAVGRVAEAIAAARARERVAEHRLLPAERLGIRHAGRPLPALGRGRGARLPWRATCRARPLPPECVVDAQVERLGIGMEEQMPHEPGGVVAMDPVGVVLGGRGGRSSPARARSGSAACDPGP